MPFIPPMLATRLEDPRRLADPRYSRAQARWPAGPAPGARPSHGPRLQTPTTKNDDGREAYMTPELRRLVAAQIERVRALERGLGRIVPDLFLHLGGRFKGQRRRNYGKAWKTACNKTGVSGRLRHDLRSGTW